MGQRGICQVLTTWTVGVVGFTIQYNNTIFIFAIYNIYRWKIFLEN